MNRHIVDVCGHRARQPLMSNDVYARERGHQDILMCEITFPDCVPYVPVDLELGTSMPPRNGPALEVAHFDLIPGIVLEALIKNFKLL